MSGVEIRFTTFLNIYIGTYIFVQVGFSYLFIHFVWQNKRYYFSIKLTHGARTAPLWGRYLRGIYVHSLYVGWNDIIKFFFFFYLSFEPHLYNVHRTFSITFSLGLTVRKDVSIWWEHLHTQTATIDENTTMFES